ncbi:hypothetical protein ACQJBY_028791 [Aegilops geniculata]
MDTPFRGGVCNSTMPPVFQTGSGKAVLPGNDSIQKARAILGVHAVCVDGALIWRYRDMILTCSSSAIPLSLKLLLRVSYHLLRCRLGMSLGLLLLFLS